jgi:long-chain acyl-CoA synthetase
MLVSDIVRRNAEYFGDNDAVVVPGGRTLSWAALEERSNRLARALLALGLRHGDRLAILAPNCGEYIELFFACAKTGVIGAACNIRLTAEQLAAYLGGVAPRVAMVHAGVAMLGRECLARLPGRVLAAGLGEGHGLELDLEELVADADPGDPGCRVSETDAYQLGATSGTTGTPKGAVLSHRNAVAAMLNFAAELEVREAETSLQCIPLFFNPGGPAGLHPVMLKGGRTVILPGFDPGTFLDAVPRHRVSHSILVPTMVAMVLAHRECGAHDLSTLRSVVCGGSPFSPQLLRRARDAFGDVFLPFYGMAETYSCGLVLRREEQHTEGTEAQLRRLGSAGRPQALMQVRVVAEGGGDVPHDGTTAGEIWLRGPSVSSGYFGMPEETAASRHGDWFRSGDLAVIDGGGFVTVVDRLKDVIITGGINVVSREVEAAVAGHPAVAEVAAIGIPDPVWVEAVHIVVVLREGAAATAEELLEHAAARLSRYQRPRSVEFVHALPLSATGKVLKTELRARHRHPGAPLSTV